MWQSINVIIKRDIKVRAANVVTNTFKARGRVGVICCYSIYEFGEPSCTTVGSTGRPGDKKESVSSSLCKLMLPLFDCTSLLVSSIWPSISLLLLMGESGDSGT